MRDFGIMKQAHGNPSASIVFEFPNSSIFFVLRISKLGPRPQGGESGGPISNLSAKHFSVSLWLVNKSGYGNLVTTVCGAKEIGVTKIRQTQ